MAYARPRRSYQPTIVGAAYLAVTVLLGVGAVNAQNNLLLFLFGITLAAILVAGFVSGSMMMGLVATRRVHPPNYAGAPPRVEYTVRNRNRVIPAFAIAITEHGLPAANARASRRRLRFPQHAFVAFIPPRGSVTVQGALPALPRGIHALTKFTTTSAFPLGVVLKAVSFAEAGEILVRPAVRRVPPVLVNRAFGLGRSTSENRRRKGSGLEFYALREYTHSDSPRQVAWKASARAGTLLTKQNASPTPKALTIRLALEPELSEAEGERRIAAAASIAKAASSLGHRVALQAPDHALATAPGAGRRALDGLLDSLARIDLTSPAAASASGPVTTGPVLTIDGSFRLDASAAPEPAEGEAP